MKPFFASRISKLSGLIMLCVVSITTFSPSAMADPIRDLQNEAIKRGKSPEDVNQAMKAKFPESFPDSDFPYFEPVNGCSTVIPLQWNIAFREACNDHDRCYATPGRSKNECDGSLLEETLKVCDSAPSGLSTVCQISGASLYYDAVDILGRDLYIKAQRQQLQYIKSVYNWLNTNAIVFHTNSYIKTGISVKSGDRIRITATGTIRFGLFTPSGGPNGIIFNPVYNYFADVPHGRLMARFRQPGMQDLDGWSPIGEGWDQVREVQLSSPGILEFLVNDNKPGDNLGKFRIEVTIHPGKQ